jgi:methylated-DNA-protein-cysteine methyltransferase-like protein
MIRMKFGNPKESFSERVVRVALSIPKGKVATYGQIARAAGGGSMASRSVTGILGKAHDAGVKNIPFHRIVYAGGKVWINDEYRKERMKRYKQEGIEFDDRGRIKDFEDKVFEKLRFQE